jgi:hypothetical protein
MKKLFTLALALLVATMGFSQVQKKQVSRHDVKKNDATIQIAPRMEAVNENAVSEPVMTSTRDLMYGDLDYTTYDWQTNHGFINRTVVWPDGKVNFAYTYASDANYTDRGTAIGTYDINTDEWTPMESRVEADRTGFGSIARYKENGIALAAHTATNLNIYLIEDKDNIPTNSVTAALNIGTDVWSHPCVTTSGPNHDIIHMVAAVFSGEEGGVTGAIRYWRSSDGENWDIVCRELPYLTIEYGTEHGTNSYYWMETTDDNMIGLVVNTGQTDGIVLYSTDNGDTWQRKIYFHDPCPGVALDNSFFYPRWTSALWDDNNKLMMAYEANTSDHQGHYSKFGGGVAFWSETMPYRGDGSSLAVWGVDPGNPMPPTPGQPFIMDSAYLEQDIYASWFLWSDKTHDMWPEYIGYLCNWTEEGYWEDPEADEWESEFNFETVSDLAEHGEYNCGHTAMPILRKVNGNSNELVAVWMTVDDEHKMDINYFYKLVAAYSCDGGMSWSHPINLVANEFEFMECEMAYPQVAVIGTTLIVAAQVDYAPGTFVQDQEDDAFDNHYTGFTFDINDLFSWYDGMPENGSNNQNVHMDIYPNPAVDQLNVTLSQNAEIVIYNIMGQQVMSQEGHAGANSININNLSRGIYFVNAGSDTQKFIVK